MSSTPRPDIKIAKRQRSPSQDEMEKAQLQRFASAVRDDEHWQAILRSADTDEQRAELNRVVGPLLPFRRASPCTTPDCDSGKTGTWQPVLMVSSPTAITEPSYVPIELRLCEKCKEDAQLSHFLTDGIWSQILGAWDDPTRPPVRRLTVLQWDRVH